MSYVLTEDQELIRRTVRELAQGGIADRAIAADRDMTFPQANVKEIASLGLLGILVPPEDGGAGADAVTLAIACEELAAACGTSGAFAAVTNAWVAYPLARHGNASQRSDLLAPLLSGEALGTFCLHEDSVGSDPQHVRTSARPVVEAKDADPASENSQAVLSGTKNLTFLAQMADFALVVARRGAERPGRRVDLYAVPCDRKGVVWGKPESRLGLRGFPTGALYLDKVEIGPGDLVGEPGEAPHIVRRSGQLLTIGIAACAVGLARAALEASVTFANEREQFGSPIAKYQAIQHNIANMRVGVDTARNMVLHAAALFDRDGEAPLASEEANVHAFEASKRATRLAIRTHGGAGFMREIPVERYARDARTLSVIGRNPDVSKTLIGLHELKVDG